VALSEKHRSSIYLTLAPMLGEEEAEALLSQFPARELDEPVTKEFVRAEIAGVRAELHERLRQQTAWMAGALVAGMGVASGIASVIR
jgi:hypothetical protein